MERTFSRGDRQCAAVIRRRGKDCDERNVRGVPTLEAQSRFPRVSLDVSRQRSENREGFEEDLGRLGQLMELQGRRVC